MAAGALDARPVRQLGEPPLAPDTAQLFAGDATSMQTPSGSNLQSGRMDYKKLSKEEIGQLLSDAPLRLPAELFDVQPSVTAPYAPGKLKFSVTEMAAKRLSALRNIAGLPSVTVDAALNENAQYGAILLAASNFDHFPQQPADMDENFFKLGTEATSSSNIAYNYSLTGSVDGYMEDSDAGNVYRVGHRRWQLNPKLGKVGYGYAVAADKSERGVEKVFDSSGEAGEYAFIAWPASGFFPNGQFGGDYAWSVSFNQSLYQKPDIQQVTVTLTRESDGQTWTFSNKETYTIADSGKYFTVENSGYGIANCIIFRPDGVETYEGRYTVKIDGLKDKSGNAVEFSYTTEFFDERDYTTTVVTSVNATPWNLLHITSAYTDAANLQKLATLLPRKVSVTTEDKRNITLNIAGSWIPDAANQCWTATLDKSTLPATVTDPDGLLDSVSLPYSVGSYTGAFNLAPSTPKAGESGTIQVWRYMSDSNVLELHQVSNGQDIVRYNQDSANFRVQAEDGNGIQKGMALFDIASWSANDSGDWYAIYYSTELDYYKDAWLAGGVSIQLGSSGGGGGGYVPPIALYNPIASGNSVSVTVTGNPGASTLYFATYDANKRMLSASMETINAPGNVQTSLDLSGASSVSVLLLDTSFKPLCAKTTTSVS